MPNGSLTGINVGVVGVGYWGRNLVRNFHDLDALAVLCDAQQSVGAHCRHEYEHVRFCSDFNAVLSDPAVDAVVIATPQHLHAQHFCDAIAAGKHVYLEKAMALSVAVSASL